MEKNELFRKLIQDGELPEVKTVVHIDRQDQFELAAVIILTALIIILANRAIKKAF